MKERLVWALAFIGVLVAARAWRPAPVETARAQRIVHVAAPSNPDPVLAEILPVPVQPAAADPAPLPAPPDSIRRQPEALRTWLLQLPQSEFGRLVGTKQLDEYVSGVIGGLQGTGHPDGPREVGAFLTQLNAQILQSR